MESGSLYEEAVKAALRGDWRVALNRFQAAVRGDLPDSGLWNGCGVAYLALDQPGRAAACFRKALRLKPDSAPVLRHLGMALWALGRFPQALEAYHRAVTLEPGDAKYHTSLAAALLSQGRAHEASPHACAAAEVDPDNCDILALMIECLRKTSRISEAYEACKRALALQCGHFAIRNNLGGLCLEQGRVDEAIAHFREAEKVSNSPAIGSNALMALLYGDSAPEAIAEEHRRWGARYYSPAVAAVRGEKRSRRQLRVGYVSGDLRDHSVAFLIEPILTKHDPHAVEIFLYPTALAEHDVSRRLRTYAAAWHPLAALDDADAARLIASHEVDILVDLSGHTSGNRLGIFARKPAPVQVSYCGYPATTGLFAIDYRITDEFCDPLGETERFHTERLWRLPSGFLSFRPPDYAPEVSPLPCSRTEWITFGCFAVRHKITDAVLSLWAEILREVAGSRLIVKNRQCGDLPIASALRDQLISYGVSADRLQFRGNSPRQEHIRDHADIDLMLDTSPYCGTVATCEALWMGVPVLTLAGSAHVSRVGVSLLSRVGLSDWIANSQEDYVRKAVRFASNSRGLAEIRAGLRARFSVSTVGDPTRVTNDLETAYRAMCSPLFD